MKRWRICGSSDTRIHRSFHWCNLEALFSLIHDPHSNRSWSTQMPLPLQPRTIERPLDGSLLYFRPECMFYCGNATASINKLTMQLKWVYRSPMWVRRRPTLTHGKKTPGHIFKKGTCATHIYVFKGCKAMQIIVLDFLHGFIPHNPHSLLIPVNIYLIWEDISGYVLMLTVWFLHCSY